MDTTEWDLTESIVAFIYTCIQLSHMFADQYQFTGHKKLNPACPSDKQLSSFACPGQVLAYFSFNVVGRQLCLGPCKFE